MGDWELESGPGRRLFWFLAVRLVFAAVFNGVAAVPLIWFIDRIAADRGTMGGARSGWLSRSMLILTFMGMAGSVVAMVISYIRG